MIEPKDGGPAFPTAETHWVEEPGGQYRDVSVDLPGMSLRDYFAGQALGSQGATWTGALLSDYPAMAARAYAIADAMLTARTQSQEPIR